MVSVSGVPELWVTVQCRDVNSPEFTWTVSSVEVLPSASSQCNFRGDAADEDDVALEEESALLDKADELIALDRLAWLEDSARLELDWADELPAEEVPTDEVPTEEEDCPAVLEELLLGSSDPMVQAAPSRPMARAAGKRTCAFMMCSFGFGFWISGRWF